MLYPQFISLFTGIKSRILIIFNTNILFSTLQFASPQIVNLLIDFVQSDEPVWKGYFYTALICLVTFINTVVNSQCFYQEYLVGLRVKTALISAIYRKSVKLSSNGRKEMTGRFSRII